ncbi:hypothetical protein ACQR2L_16625 [Clostridium butyricum]|uniref:hypothetical protein n=1 Tax=Clostridium butyricum TaxID=1492 RepID=UPI003D0E948A
MSNLRFLTDLQKVELSAIIRNIPEYQISLPAWKDALCNLTDAPPQKTSALAKKRLIFELERSLK